MIETDLRTFANCLALAADGTGALDALCRLAQSHAPARLFTITLIDLDAGQALRVYSNMPQSDPVSGRKPVTRDGWFRQVIEEQRSFVANTAAEIAAVFPDQPLIARLGCDAVVNLPIVLGGRTVATVNLLDRAHSYPAETLTRIEDTLLLPAMSALAVYTVLARSAPER
ncbi:GAF domain-containing protein [Ruegeria pomeroyi]|nr:GAF domain-containing protein [Ruegeria pomeroyi]